MTDAYQIFGSEMSPYSVKVRSYFRYKGLPHFWIPRRAENDEDYRRYARLPIVPTVATPDGQGLQGPPPRSSRPSRPSRRRTPSPRSIRPTRRSRSCRR